MTFFKVEMNVWVESDNGCAMDHIDCDLDARILDWTEIEMCLTEAPWVGHMCEGCPECGPKP